ncbi:MAG: hypothetical protein K2K97_11855, partial [Muribaculaceae bacterium]|nr:hypothetical protein [Muribaculaceae bacterium]
ISNRVKRNIHFALFCIGIMLVLARVWDVALNPSSAKAWFHLIGISIITYGCFDSYCDYRKRLAKGLLFGSK